jgi:CPA1 family monovalent cation:H+ antiporter
MELMESFETLIILMFAAAILVGISQKCHVPYPLTLILAGAVIGFLPKSKIIEIEPNLILGIVLPPVLYYAAFGISFREFKKNWSQIISLALGLVAFTTIVIGVLFKWIFPEFPWALAFTFGAIISPPDAVAATIILKRFSISNRLLTVLEGESLVNDASALVIYRLCILALLSGVFSFSDASADFVLKVSGGVGVGLLSGYLFQNFSRQFLEPIVGVVFSFTIPYVIYIVADYLNVSGILAVVTNGLIGSQVLLRHHSPFRRILGYAVWDIFVILMNCFVFILIGLHLKSITSTMTSHQMFEYTGYAFFFTFAMIVVRMFWVFAKSAIPYFKAMMSPKHNTLCPQILRESTLIGWAGMRGIVSLTTALALPFVLPNDLPLEGRNEVVFITFVVIMLTLLIPSLTMPFLIRRMNIPEAPHHQDIQVKKQLASVAEETVNELYNQKKINNHEWNYLADFFKLKFRSLEIASTKIDSFQNLEYAKNLIIRAQRKKLIEIWEHLEIDDKTLGEIEHELDLEETHFMRAELK